jgi:putative transposase
MSRMTRRVIIPATVVNGTGSKRVIPGIGPIEFEVSEDRSESFEPVIVPKRTRRLGGVNQMVLLLSAKGLTHGDIRAPLEEVYGAEASKETVPVSPTRWSSG